MLTLWPTALDRCTRICTFRELASAAGRQSCNAFPSHAGSETAISTYPLCTTIVAIRVEADFWTCAQPKEVIGFASKCAWASKRGDGYSTGTS